jgi:hypothetical protein
MPVSIAVKTPTCQKAVVGDNFSSPLSAAGLGEYEHRGPLAEIESKGFTRDKIPRHVFVH